MTAQRLAYPLDEAAAQLGVSKSTVEREIRDGRLRARRVRGCVRITGAEIERYLGSTDVVASSAEHGREQKRAAIPRRIRLVSLAPLEAAR
jgi:excisionase family DNA binding protein